MSHIHFYKEGKGPAVILIHGFCESGEMWRDYSSSISSTHTCYSIDLPGFGLSPLSQKQITIEEIAIELSDWMSDQKIESPILIGHSLGGYVALALLEFLGSEIKGIGLFNSTSFGDSIEKKAMRDRAFGFIEKFGVGKFVDSFVPQLFPSPRRVELEQDIIKAVKDAHRSSLQGLLAYTYAMRERRDRSLLLRDFEGKKLMICGTEDSSIPIEDSRKQEAFVTDYHEIKDMGHMGMIEKKENCLEILLKFLSDDTD